MIFQENGVTSPGQETGGSHRQFEHLTKPGVVTVPGNMGDELAPGTLNSVLKQAGLKE